MKRISRGLFYSLGGCCCRNCFKRGRHKKSDKRFLRKSERRHYKKQTKSNKEEGLRL